jgi:purine-binding chemotaxis protein CheW
MKTDVVKLVTFRLGADLFAAEVNSVERVLRYVVPAAVPEVPSWISGVIEYQRRVVPVVDLRLRVELPAPSLTATSRTLVLNTSAGWVGAIVDAVFEVATVPATSISPPPPLFRGLSADLLKGIARIAEQLVIVLDVDRVLTSTDRIVLERAIPELAGRA